MSDENVVSIDGDTPLFEELSDEESQAAFTTETDEKPASKFHFPKFSTGTTDYPTPSAREAKKLCAELPDMYRMLGMGLCAVDPICGMGIVENADALGESWMKLAETSPAFRRFLARLKAGSGWGAVLMAHAPLAIMAAQHHMPEVFGTDKVENDTADVA